MARRQNRAVDEAIAQPLALGGLGFAFVPPLRVALLWMAVLLAIAGLTIVVFRIARRRAFEIDAGAGYRSAILQGLRDIPAAPVRTITSVTRNQDHYDLRKLDWYQFEKLIALLFEQEGFVVQRKGGANPDGGIDLTATKDGVTFGVQCKHWKTWRVGVDPLRSFYGALGDHKLRNGFFVTLEGYTKEAADFAGRNNIDLLDEATLLKNLEAVNWRFNPAFAAMLNDARKLCPKCEADMVLRTARRGWRAGQSFWACSTYPRCNGKINATPAGKSFIVPTVLPRSTSMHHEGDAAV